MTPLVVVLPDELLAFLEAELVRTGIADSGRYLVSLLETARRQAIEARLTALLQAGAATDVLPGAFDLPLAMHRSAVEDVNAEAERLATRGLGGIADRFRTAVKRALNAIAQQGGEGGASVAASLGSPITVWPLPGFSDQQVYTVRERGQVRILRVLHRVRDVEAWVAKPPVSTGQPPQ